MARAKTPKIDRVLKSPVNRAAEYRRLEWHINASFTHMNHAVNAAKKLGVTKKVLYVTHSSMWWSRSILEYMKQIKYRLEHEQRTETTDSTQ